MSFYLRTIPSKGLKFREGELKFFIALYSSGEVKNLRLIMVDDKSKLSKERRNNAITTKRICIWFFKKFFWEIRRLLSMNDKKEIGIGIKRFFVLFSSIWKIGAI